MPVDKNQRNIPLVAIRDSVVFPHTDSILTFGRPKSVSAIDMSFQGDRVIGIFTQKDAKTIDPKIDDLYKTGTVATITQMMQVEGEIHAMVRGQARVKLDEILSTDPHLVAKVTELTELDTEDDETKALARQLGEIFKKAVNLGKSVDVTTIMKMISGKIDPVELVDNVASLLSLKTSQKQKLLNTVSVKKRLKKVVELLSTEVNVLDIEKTISKKTQKRFEDSMRKAMLREKKKTIEEELGEDGGATGEDEIGEFRAKIKAAKMPKVVRRKAVKELKKLSKLSSHNPEGGYIRNYLDWLVDMPWSKASPGDVSIKKAAKILDDDHYGLEKAKQRILEYLAVMQLKKQLEKKSKKGKSKKEAAAVRSQSTILCFIGPPGTGKTSIGKSIAKAMDRKFIRVSLGGLRDEAEIRGHRRTYVGAMPGRLIQGIKNAETNNPVFMLDEVDKLGVDFRGDPSSALLEALDPEQNSEFSDHYLEVPFDLSQVMFICTGNVMETIPGPLRDRMEIIKFPGYIQEEKIGIAKKYLWPKQIKAHGLEKRKISIKREALSELIARYTREAGVRNLERNLASISRKIVRLAAEKKEYPKVVKSADVKKLLGPRKFSSRIAEKKDEVGMATGLSVSAVGGDIIFIEVSLMPGKGKLTLTGQLGDVMQESAKAAFTWAKAHWSLLGLEEGFGRKIDVHIHVPEGGVPKDGPSAGVSMSTALISALTGVPVKRYVGMTGEITLRGRVLEIGGVKEKTIAAHTAGLKTVVMPKENKKDLEDIPEKVKKGIDFVFAEKLEQVLKVTLKQWPVTVASEEFSSRPTILISN